jgi:ATP-dependent DNA helicase RecG
LRHVEIMAEEFPEEAWVDPAASRQLVIMCAQGEGQTIEFMQSFPEQAHELAKEIAAFATSNAGTILIGVDDEGACVGISACSATERDLLRRRVEGICKGPVKPSITPTAAFARNGQQIVLMLTIPKGSQPIYYSKHVPYVRHLTSSRPAEPHEVIELVLRSVQPQIQPSTSESARQSLSKRTQFVAELMQILVSVIIFDTEFDKRSFNPWLEEMRAQFGNAASRLREAAAEQTAVDDKLDARLLDAAEDFSRFAKLRLHLGSGAEMQTLWNLAIKQARALLDQIEPEVIPHVSLEQITEPLRALRRQLTALQSQAKTAPRDGSIQDLQSAASNLGRRILNLSEFGVDRLAPHLKAALLQSGHLLHTSETEQLFLDGGASARQIAQDVQQAVSTFNEAVEPVLPHE